MNDPKGTRRRPIQLKFYVNEKELKRIKKKMKVFDIPKLRTSHGAAPILAWIVR